MPINQPSNQIKLTNVALVRMKKGKKRYEIACYKNKVLEWRSGSEKDIDNVLQIPNVFLSVSKGQVAPNEDLNKSFPKKTREEITLEILNKGELQVGEKERSAQLERVHNEVIDIVAGKLVDPRTKRVYTTGMIEKALDQLSSQRTHAPESKGAPSASGTATPTTDGDKEKVKTKDLPSWTGVVTTRSAKSQALDAMKALIAHQPIPVGRARMRLRITCPTSILKQSAKMTTKSTEEGADGEEIKKSTVKDCILSFVEQAESQETVGEEWELVGFVEPGAYKSLTEFVGTQTKGRARAEVLDMAVMHEGD
ncbi:Shwachman-Bodian-diamond syndrome protein [Pseudovirgaria hyperparasitica]|uniref:Ribosome maturation protein SDO1 n=1 Tax=Pseudovirgaria hyperparasitica TaxID=470096 RepID=A0A6A6W3Z8_9PEZI|nr:Shwachman-Bodian-diamond syndrome protein [Pseudovirgaria hyperparasitica]KAF2756889.1 Shwachman-Bodian-diamond syndrome protein [Pseudovirgaria hyperparasitica]